MSLRLRAVCARARRRRAGHVGLDAQSPHGGRCLPALDSAHCQATPRDAPVRKSAEFQSRSFLDRFGSFWNELKATRRFLTRAEEGNSRRTSIVVVSHRFLPQRATPTYIQRSVGARRPACALATLSAVTAAARSCCVLCAVCVLCCGRLGRGSPHTVHRCARFARRPACASSEAVRHRWRKHRGPRPAKTRRASQSVESGAAAAQPVRAQTRHGDARARKEAVPRSVAL